MSEIDDNRRDGRNSLNTGEHRQEEARPVRSSEGIRQHLSKLSPERALELEDIVETLQDKRPQFINSFLANAGKNLEQYAADLLKTATVPSERFQRAFVHALVRHDPGVDGASIVRELQKGVLVDTSGHCGLIGDTESIHSLLLLGLAARRRGDTRVFALAGGGVPLDNATLPGGFYWDGKRVNLHPKKIMGESSGSMLVSTVEACSLQSALQLSDKYKGPFDAHGFPTTIQALAPERRSFATFLQQAISKPNSPVGDLFKDKNLRFCDQVARLNEFLWTRLGATDRGLPGLAYGLLEDVSNTILKELILTESGSPPSCSNEPMYRVLFDKDLRNDVLEAFNRANPNDPPVQGAWRHESDRSLSYGTHLFWLLEGTPYTEETSGKLSIKNARQIRLSLSKDGVLSSDDDRFIVEMTPENVRDLLDGVQDKNGRGFKLWPGTFLNIALLTMENCSIIGGMNQADYAATYQRTLAPLLSQRVPGAAVEKFQQLTLDNFCLGLLFTCINNKEGSFEHLLLHPQALVEEVNQSARTMSVAEAGLLDIVNWVNTIIPKAEFHERLPGKISEVQTENGKTAWRLDPRFSFSNLYREMRSVTPSGS